MLVTHRCRDFGMNGQVIPGDGIIVVEAVKMENELKASCCGTVTEVRVEEGRSVNGVDVLVVIE